MPVTVWLSALAAASSIPILLWSLRSGPRVSAEAVRRNLGGPGPDLRARRLERPLAERLLGPVLDAVAARAARLLPAQRRDAWDRLLAVSGQTGRWTPEQLLAAKLLAGGLVALLAAIRLAAQPTGAAAAIAALLVVAAYLAPDVVLRRLASARRLAMERDLPDVLDQLTISVEAGLGFEAALQRVVRSTPGPLCEEFGRMLQDVQVGTRRAVALENLAQRTDAPDLRHVAVSLVQSERLGVPLAHTLRTQAREMRAKRRMRAEESANKIAVKLLFPVVFCLFPGLFIVILGPAALRMAGAF